MMRDPRVAVIVLNWNGGEDTLACLDSLTRLDYPSNEVILVDNGSKDGSVAAIRPQFPRVHLIENGENLGFVGGNNVGLRQAEAMGFEFALFLNNDTEVAPDFLNLLIEAIKTDPEVGVVGPTIYYSEQPNTIWSAGGEIDWQRGMTRMVGLNEPDQGQYGELPRSVDFVTGCALLLKMELIRLVGPLDPRFFAYYEEVEWCLRVARAGFKILHVPKAKIWHKISIEERERSPQVHYYMTRNRLLFLKLSKAGLATWLHTLLFDYARTLLSWSIRPKWRHKGPQRRAMVLAILDFFSRRYGKVAP